MPYPEMEAVEKFRLILSSNGLKFPHMVELADPDEDTISY